MLLVTPEPSETTNLNPSDTNLNPLDIGLSPVNSSSCGLVQLTTTNVSDRRHRDTWPFHRAHASLGRCAVHAEGRAGILLLTCILSSHVSSSSLFIALMHRWDVVQCSQKGEQHDFPKKKSSSSSSSEVLSTMALRGKCTRTLTLEIFFFGAAVGGEEKVFLCTNVWLRSGACHDGYNDDSIQGGSARAALSRSGLGFRV
jgi:hypothetical protein